MPRAAAPCRLCRRNRASSAKVADQTAAVRRPRPAGPAGPHDGGGGGHRVTDIRLPSDRPLGPGPHRWGRTRGAEQLVRGYEQKISGYAGARRTCRRSRTTKATLSHLDGPPSRWCVFVPSPRRGPGHHGARSTGGPAARTARPAGLDMAGLRPGPDRGDRGSTPIWWWPTRGNSSVDVERLRSAGIPGVGDRDSIRSGPQVWKHRLLVDVSVSTEPQLADTGHGRVEPPA